jgi:hypothetical protein
VTQDLSRRTPNQNYHRELARRRVLLKLRKQDSAVIETTSTAAIFVPAYPHDGEGHPSKIAVRVTNKNFRGIPVRKVECILRVNGCRGTG